MKQAVADVFAFHDAMGVPCGDKPALISPDREALRLNLMNEEFEELWQAVRDGNLIEIADACADLCYVVIGTAIEYGIPLDVVWAEVHRSNMAKADPATGKVRFREDGKVLKPEGWKPPDIAAILR